MNLKFTREKKIVAGLILICLIMIIISYKQVLNLFDTPVNGFIKNNSPTDLFWQFNVINLINSETEKDENGNTFYILKNGVNNCNLLNISVRSGYSENENPKITFTYFNELPGGIIIEKETSGRFNNVTYTLIDYRENYLNKVFVIENDIKYSLKNIEYTIENLPSGNYRIQLKQINNADNNPIFQIYDAVPANWSLNENRLQSLDLLSFLINLDIDTRWYYINDNLKNEPLLETLYKVYKNGRCYEEKGLRNYDQQILLENKVCKTKNKFFFRTQNPVKEWIENEIIPDSVSIDEFIHSPEFKNLIEEKFGDSLAVRFGLSIEPMQWSHYNYQYIYSDYYVIPSERIYENFIKKRE